jgi:hypothetical protein
VDVKIRRIDGPSPERRLRSRSLLVVVIDIKAKSEDLKKKKYIGSFVTGFWFPEVDMLWTRENEMDLEFEWAWENVLERWGTYIFKMT